MARDRVDLTDKVSVTMENAGLMTARHPCPECGKETKLHHDGTRICSVRNCKQRVEKLATRD